jgi:hypothetical protein
MATYDPSKNYTWQPDAKFVIEGREFGLILNILRGILSTQEATTAILAYEANQKIENIIAAAVAEGKVTEAVQQQPPMPVMDIPVDTGDSGAEPAKMARKELKKVK